MIGLLRSLFGGAGTSVGPQEAMRRMNDSAVLVDVREPGEFAGGHAPMAVPLPLGRIRSEGGKALEALRIPQEAEILLICRSGMRSRLAQSALSKDARRCLNVAGGMRAWTAAGLPVVRVR